MGAFEPPSSALHSGHPLLLKIHPLHRLWRAITTRRRMQLVVLLVFTVGASIAEVLSIGAVLPLLGALTAPEKLYSSELARPFIEAMGITSANDLLWPITVVFSSAAIAAAIVRAISIWLRTRLTFAAGADLSTEIYRRTLHQPYLVHLSRNSSEVIDAMSEKVSAVISGVLQPVIVILSNSLMLFIILAALLWYEPQIALSVFGGFSVVYGVIYLGARARLRANSRQIATNSTLRVKTLQEGLGGIRDVLIDNSQNVYCMEYQRTDQRLRMAQANNIVAGEVPRFAIEAVGMVLIALLTLQLAKGPEGFSVALPLIGALAIAAQRLLPLLQQIYYAMTALSGSQQSLADALTLLEQPLPKRINIDRKKRLHFHQSLVCKQLSFRYGDESPWVLRNLDLSIPKGSRIGVVGTTGSGKSTLIDLLMGLIQPSEGALLVDDQVVNDANTLQWQSHIAHVPQAIYLSDASVAENIAFGVPLAEIDMARVRRAAERAQIDITIEGWHQGYQTLVGERGVRLSGGQRQRIGIARALYKQADVLIFDEATSALDTETEDAVMKAINQLGRDLTIIIVAHRLSTLSGCDLVVAIKSGRAEIQSI